MCVLQILSKKENVSIKNNVQNLIFEQHFKTMCSIGWKQNSFVWVNMYKCTITNKILNCSL